jgi:hypothetical protein
LALSFLSAASGFLHAQTLTDIGTANPTPGPNDIYQLSTNGNQEAPDGLNYYSNNSQPPGQTFTTGANSTNLVAMAVRTAGLNNGDGYGTPATVTNYYLRLYSVSGSTATLLQTYTNLNPGFTDGEWLKWNNLSVPLAANSTYAYTISVLPGNSSSWVALAVANGNPYSGGQIALIPTNGGTITFGSSHNFDAVFDAGMSANPPTANTPVAAPQSTVYIGQTVTFTESALGTGTLSYQWQTDGGGGGSLTNIPGATGTNVAVAPPVPGTYNYDIIVSNSYGSETSYVASVIVLPPSAVNINVANTMATMPLQGLGVCSAVYDNDLIDARVAPLLKAAGISAVRYSGGSYADLFNWETTTVNDGAYINTEDSFANFMKIVVNPADAHAIITVNYGSNPENNAGGVPSIAAAWVADANVTNNWDIKYWEIGNEVYGNGYVSGSDWEYDLHDTNQTASKRVGQPTLSPAAYGTNAIQFINDMKAQDSTINCGVFFNTSSSSWNTSLLDVCGNLVDFVIIHWYPGSDTASTLAASTTIVPQIVHTFTQLSNIVGSAKASQMKIAITETGAGSATGAAVSLFAADNYLTWLENGIVNVDYQILHPDILDYTQVPGHAYYGAQMCHLLANVGDTFLQATSAQSELRVHATQRQDGQTGVMLVNMDRLISIAAAVNISGPALATSGTKYQFGLTNYLAGNEDPPWPASTNHVSGLGNSFTVSVPPYTIIDLLIPTNTPPVLAEIGNQTVNVGQTVNVSASATDPIQPTPTLTFSLSSAPTNATLTQINNTNAAFNWRPLISQANSTNPISLTVTDNGSPPLSATQNFSVMVNPITLPTISGSDANLAKGQFSLTISGIVGPDYAIQLSTSLEDWSTVFETNSPLLPFNWVDTNASLTNPATFYRVLLGPPPP